MSIAIVHSDQILLESLANNLEEYSPYIFKNLNDLFSLNDEMFNEITLLIVDKNQDQLKSMDIYKTLMNRRSNLTFLFLGFNDHGHDDQILDHHNVNFLSLPFTRSEVQFKVDILCNGPGKFCFRKYYPSQRVSFENVEKAYLVSGEIEIESVNFARSFTKRTELLEISSFKNLKIVKTSEFLLAITDKKYERMGQAHA